MNLKFDNIILGICLGTIFPLIFIYCFFLFRFKSFMTFEEFINTVLVMKIYTKVLAVSIFAGNLTSFMLFLKINRLKTARGIFIVTVLYSIMVFIMKLSF